MRHAFIVVRCIIWTGLILGAGLSGSLGLTQGTGWLSDHVKTPESWVIPDMEGSDNDPLTESLMISVYGGFLMGAATAYPLLWRSGTPRMSGCVSLIAGGIGLLFCAGFA